MSFLLLKYKEKKWRETGKVSLVSEYFLGEKRKEGKGRQPFTSEGKL